ncbi:MAG: molybdopterin converting factor subunit 1 [Myxococcota bacterium]
MTDVFLLPLVGRSLWDYEGAMFTVLYFAAARERVGVDQEAIDLERATVGELRQLLLARHPQLAPMMALCRVAVGHAFATDDVVIEAGAEVAIIPPVAGGDGTTPLARRVRVTETPLSVDEVLGLVVRPAAGAQVVMIGCVRDHAEGVAVDRLEYEAYAPMAEKVLAELVNEVEESIPGALCAVHHRTGPLAIGDRAVVVAASAAHRAEAFSACQRLIDRLKEDVPIWNR